MELIPLACDRLSRTELKKLLWTQADGVFFKSPPMVFYGGSPLAYGVAFSMIKPSASLRLSIP